MIIEDLHSWISTGYPSNSTGSFVTNYCFSMVIGSVPTRPPSVTLVHRLGMQLPNNLIYTKTKIKLHAQHPKIKTTLLASWRHFTLCLSPNTHINNHNRLPILRRHGSLVSTEYYSITKSTMSNISYHPFCHSIGFDQLYQS